MLLPAKELKAGLVATEAMSRGLWASAPAARSSAIRVVHGAHSLITLPVGQVAAYPRPGLHS